MEGKIGKTYVMGDIHGAYRALIQCLRRSSFDYGIDRLIFLGDVADGWPETYACIEELLKIKNVDYVFGNHDFWTLEWMQTGFAEDVWLDQGGRATVSSYHGGVPESHKKLLNHSHPYLVDNNRLFVHAGFNVNLPIDNQPLSTLLWDRKLAYAALACYEAGNTKKLTTYDEVYLGHTPVASPVPIHACDVWLMDTGAGWSGILSMMNVDTKEIFSSDPVPTLYPGVQGRKRNR